MIFSTYIIIYLLFSIETTREILLKLMLMVVISADNLSAGIASAAFVAYLLPFRTHTRLNGLSIRITMSRGGGGGCGGNEVEDASGSVQPVG